MKFAIVCSISFKKILGEMGNNAHNKYKLIEAGNQSLISRAMVLRLLPDYLYQFLRIFLHS
jgi:hypothetical protein